MNLLIPIILTLFVSACSKHAVDKLDEAARPQIESKDKVKGVSLTFEPKVDILFVIDDSGSMNTHQRNMSRQVDKFTNKIAQNFLLDYHIGVVTTSMDVFSDGAGHLLGTPPWIQKTTPNKEAELAARMQPGSNGSGDEKFFEPVMAALSPPVIDGVNKGFYREDAFLAIVYITDTGVDEAVTAKAAYDFLVNLKKGDDNKLAAYAALVTPGNPLGCRYDSEWGNGIAILIRFLSYFETFGSSTGKNYFDLCSPNFGSELAKIGEDLENRIELFVPLKEFPVLSTMQISYGSQIIPQDEFYGWSYNAERVGIIFGRGLVLKKQENVELSIDYIPAEL